MKKIISILASVAMMVSVSATAFAAAPTGAAPVISVSTGDLGGGIYTADIDLSGLGTLHRTGNAFSHTATVINMVSVTLKSDIALGDTILATDASFDGTEDSTLGALSTTMVTKIDDNTVQVSYAPSGVASMYPNAYGTSTTSVDNALSIMLMPSATPTFTVTNWKIGYVQLQNGKAVAGSAEFKYPVNITKDYEGDNGYVWGVSFSQSGALDSLTATFEDSNGNSQSAEATNIGAAAGFTGAGVVSFDIGLNTTKTITSATFDVVSGTGTTSFGSGTGTWN